MVLLFFVGLLGVVGGRRVQGVAAVVGVCGGVARGGGQARGLPVTLSARGRGGSQVQGVAQAVSRQRRRRRPGPGRDGPAGCAAPPQTPTTDTHHSTAVSLMPALSGARLFREDKEWVLLLGLSGRGRVRAPGRFPGCGQAGGAVGHPFAARGGMECCDRCGRSGSIRGGDSPQGGGHDQHDPLPTAW